MSVDSLLGGLHGRVDRVSETGEECGREKRVRRAGGMRDTVCRVKVVRLVREWERLRERLTRQGLEKAR